MDLKRLRKLEYLYCDNNKLKKLNISGLKNLGYLHCRNNVLKWLDITKNRHLYELHCENNKIKKLDIRNCVMRISYGDEFFTYDEGIVLVRKHKNKK